MLGSLNVEEELDIKVLAFFDTQDLSNKISLSWLEWPTCCACLGALILSLIIIAYQVYSRYGNLLLYFIKHLIDGWAVSFNLLPLV